MTLRCISYNCKGFNSSVMYILSLMKSCDILCLTETWLRPDELNLVERVFNDNTDFNASFSVFAKSSN